MNSLQKVAIFLFLIGLQKGKNVIALMDNDEIRLVIPQINKLPDLSQETQESIWSEFKQLGYEEQMSPSDTLSIIRSLFNSSKISDKSTRPFFR